MPIVLLALVIFLVTCRFFIISLKVFSCRNPEYYGDEHLRNTADEDLVHRTGVSAANYDSHSVPQQPEVLKEETPDTTQGNQYSFPSSTPGYPYDNSQQLNAAFNNQQQTTSQVQNIAPFSSVMVM